MNKKLIHSIFEDVAERLPEKAAVVYKDRKITYGELNARSNRIAHALHGCGVGRGSVAGILIPGSIEYMAAVIGVLKSGGIFMPLEPSSPEKRLGHILNKTSPRVIITTSVSEYAGLIPEHMLPERLLIISEDCGFKILQPKGFKYTASDKEFPETNPVLKSEPDDGNYIIFTSGSTGEPKAIEGCHKGLSHFVHWEIGEFGLDETTRGSQLSPTTFDVSLRDIFVPLSAGGTVCIPDNEARMNTGLLLKWMEESGLTLMHCVPSIFRLLLREFEASGAGGNILSRMRHILLAGEALYGSDVIKWMELVGDRIELANLYGPSETTLAKACYRIKARPAAPNMIIPVGKPISNTAILILKDNELCRIGEVGEICIKTPFRTRGYYKDPELTAKGFVRNPLNEAPEDIIYKTGDLGRYLPDRCIEFIGRIDSQFKVNGIRVELAEVEKAVLSNEAVSQAVVTVHKNAGHDNLLVCYYIGNKGIDNDEMRKYLASYLPGYMIPFIFVRMDEFPLSLNGKIDRKRLPRPEELIYERIKYEPPEGDVERVIAGIWTEVLGLKKIGVNNRFLEIGGNSLSAIRIISQIYRAFDVEVSIRDFFENETIKKLAGLVGGSVKSAYREIRAVEKKVCYELSHSQRRLWLLYQMGEGPAAYNIPDALLLEGELDVEALKKAFKTVVQRHESLRTAFSTVDGVPMQRIDDEMQFRVEELDLRAEAGAEKIARKYAQEDAVAPFDLSQGPLLRVKLLRLPERRYALLFNIHHIISDGWSLEVLVNEVLAFYRAYVKGEGPRLPPLKIHYKDFAAWQNDLLKTDDINRHRHYWHEKLSGELPALDLHTDYPRPVFQTFNGSNVRGALEGDIADKLQRLGRENKASLFMTLVSFVKILLYRYTSQEDIIIGTPIAGRDHPDLANQIGCYVNTLPIRDRLTAGDSFKTVLGKVRQSVTDAFDHQVYPFDRLVDELGLERDTSRSAVFEAGVALNTERQAELMMDNVRVSSLDIASGRSKYDLVFTFTETGGRLWLDINYNTDLFREDRISRMEGHMAELMRSVFKDPETSIGSLNILTRDERHDLIFRFNDTFFEYPDNKTIAGLFEEQVRRTPQNTALVLGDRSLTYEGLNRLSNSLAHRLKDNCKIQPEDIIGLMVDRNEWMIIGILGILKAGGAFLPLDPEYPAERLNFMLQDSSCKVLLAAQEYLRRPAAGLRPRDGKQPDLKVVDITATAEGNASTPENMISEDNLAYVIYTSGSTGKPKGVGIRHRGFINMSLAQIRAFGLLKTDRVLQFASLSFDASLSEIFMALFSGATLVPVKKETINDTGRFLEFVDKNRITVATFPPVYLSALNKSELKTVRTIITAGEPAAVDDALFYGSRKRYFNAYGPTEASVCASFHMVDPERAYDDAVPIGRPVANTSIYILDALLNIVPVGVAGEICISGAGLARGYLNNSDSTGERFIKNPFREGERLYRTGDLGIWLPDGNIEFIGRKDDQLKIRGYRIEKGEIENTLRKHPDIKEALIIQRRGKNGEKELTAYYTRNKGIELWPSIAEFFVYDDIVYHSMADDGPRNKRYAETFKKVLRGKKVLEIGPGPEAVLSRLCIEAGAEKVYAVELLKETSEKARARVKSLGLEDRIIIIHGDIIKVGPPEKVDWCVSEIVGAIGGSEGAAALINSARRFLHDPSCMIPSRGLTKIAAVSLSEDRFSYAFSETPGRYVERIFEKAGRGFDLRVCLKNFSTDILVSTSDVFEDLDFTMKVPIEGSHEICLKFTRDAVFNGFMVWLNLYTDDAEVIDILELRGSWLPVYLPLHTEGIDVSNGDCIKAVVSRRLSQNGLNPDFFIKGSLIRKDKGPVEFIYESRHMSAGFRENSFYERLFPGGSVKIRPELSAGDIRAFLSGYLPDYMIPNHLIGIDGFPVTPSGKVDKSALPEPAGVSGERYEPPSTLIETAMAAILKELLGRDKIGIYDNYFALGGDSIKAIQFVTRLHQQGLKLEVMDIYRHPTVAELATQASTLDRIAEQAPVTGTVPLTAIQRWFFQTYGHDMRHFNQAAVLFSGKRLREDALRAVLKEIQDHHDALRMRYREENGIIIQENAGPDYPLSFETVDLMTAADAASRLQSHAGEIQKGLSLTEGPLLRVVLYRLTDGDRLLIVIHHLVIDGISWRILLEDLSLGYGQYLAGESPRLPVKTDSFRRWAEQMQLYAGSGDLLKETGYWRDIVTTPVKPLPRDYPGGKGTLEKREDNISGGRREISFTLSEDETDRLLTKINQVYNTEVNDILLTALARAMKKWHGQDKTLITLEGHGREDILKGMDISRTVGWFTSMYPLILETPDSEDLGYQIRYIKETLRKIPNKGIGYGILKYITPAENKEGMSFKVSPGIGFNYFGRFDEDLGKGLFEIAEEACGETVSPQAKTAHDLDINGMVVGGRMTFSISYDQNYYKRGTIETIGSDYRNELLEIITHCLNSESTGLTPSDIDYDGLSIDELDEVLGRLEG